MTQDESRADRPVPAGSATAPLARGLLAGWLASALLFAGCAVEFQNRQARQELDRQSAPPGSVYTGWRVFQDRCAACHGDHASGSVNTPDLLVQVRAMGPRRFVDAVLKRYDMRLPDAPPGSDEAARDALIDRIVQRQAGALTMPAWQGEPTVNAHIADLYAYLSARAEGTQGTGRPRP